MTGRQGITGLLKYWLCVKMPAAGRVHRRIERKVCQQISGWSRNCSLRNASTGQNHCTLQAGAAEDLPAAV